MCIYRCLSGGDDSLTDTMEVVFFVGDEKDAVVYGDADGGVEGDLCSCLLT